MFELWRVSGLNDADARVQCLGTFTHRHTAVGHADLLPPGQYRIVRGRRTVARLTTFAEVEAEQESPPPLLEAVGARTFAEAASDDLY